MRDARCSDCAFLTYTPHNGPLSLGYIMKGDGHSTGPALLPSHLSLNGSVDARRADCAFLASSPISPFEYSKMTRHLLDLFVRGSRETEETEDPRPEEQTAAFDPIL